MPEPIGLPAYSLARLISPQESGSFLASCWGRAVCHFPQALGADLGELLDLGGFERTIAALNRPADGWLHLARGGLRAIPPAMLDSDGMVDLRKLRAAFADGDTLYLTKAERLVPSLARLGRAVERDLAGHRIALRRPVNAHIFLTPPGCQGFEPHRDEHASFILQLEGSKEWIVYAPEEGTGFDPGGLRPGAVERASLDRLRTAEHRLEAGDVLYMPEWWPHEARTSADHSLHVTLRVFPLRWRDLLADICSGHPALARPIGPGETGGDLAAALTNLLGSVEFLAPLPGMIEAFAARRGVPESALAGDGLRQILLLDRIVADTRLERPAGMTCSVFVADSHACIAFPGGVIRGPAVMRDLFDFVASVTDLRPCDLPLPSDALVDPLEVVRTMVRDGLLRIADPGA